MASALPMPALPPVINIVLPVIFIGVSLNKSAIGEYRLAVYPRALIAAECGNDIGNIGRLAQSFVRRALGKGGDLLRGFAVGKQWCIDYARRNGIDRDPTPFKFLGEAADKHILSHLGGCVGAISRGAQLGDTGGQADNPPTITDATGGFAQGIEAAFSVHRPHTVK